MNRELSVSIAKPYAQELSHKLSVVLDEPELLEETTKRHEVAQDDIRTAMRELDQRGGDHCFSVSIWRVIADEAVDCDGIGETFQRVCDAVAGATKAVQKRVERPARASGNVATKYFNNTSRFPDALVKEMISFILEGGRLPERCAVKITQGLSKICNGLGGEATRLRGYGRRSRVRGGSVFVKANIDHRTLAKRGGFGGYLPFTYYGATEDFFAVLAHEIRHVQQGYKPLARECRKVRRHTFGTNAKLDEIDATLFEIRTLRRFRREWPSVVHKVLPLP